MTAAVMTAAVMTAAAAAGESREQRDLVYVDAQGVQRGSKPVDEALVDRQQKGVLPGKVSGRQLRGGSPCSGGGTPCALSAADRSQLAVLLLTGRATCGLHRAVIGTASRRERLLHPARPSHTTALPAVLLGCVQVMRVVEGRHSGLLCEVVSLEAKQEGRSGAPSVTPLPATGSLLCCLAAVHGEPLPPLGPPLLNALFPAAGAHA
jgi:hypothetical protein